MRIERDFPDLPTSVASLVRSGVYTIFETTDPTCPFVLVTKTGLRAVSETGSLAPLEGKSLSDFGLRNRVRPTGALSGPIVRWSGRAR